MHGDDRLICALVALVPMSLNGCAGVHRSSDVLALKVSAHPLVRDIPVPEGFRLVDQSCEDWASGPIRYIRHRYTGRADKHAVRRFYREQMPLVRWTAISDANLHGRFTMRFERSKEYCTVFIDSPAARKSDQVIVDVIISPANR